MIKVILLIEHLFRMSACCYSVYLLSDSATMTNGIKLPIDGGYLAS